MERKQRTWSDDKKVCRMVIKIKNMHKQKMEKH